MPFSKASRALNSVCLASSLALVAITISLAISISLLFILSASCILPSERSLASSSFNLFSSTLSFESVSFSLLYSLPESTIVCLILSITD